MIRVRTSDGTLRIKISGDNQTLRELKESIYLESKIPVDLQVLSRDISGNEVIGPDNVSLRDLRVMSTDLIYLVGRLEKKVISKSFVNEKGEVVSAGTTIIGIDGMNKEINNKTEKEPLDSELKSVSVDNVNKTRKEVDMGKNKISDHSTKNEKSNKQTSNDNDDLSSYQSNTSSQKQQSQSQSLSQSENGTSNPSRDSHLENNRSDIPSYMPMSGDNDDYIRPADPVRNMRLYDNDVVPPPRHPNNAYINFNSIAPFPTRPGEHMMDGTFDEDALFAAQLAGLSEVDVLISNMLNDQNATMNLANGRSQHYHNTTSTISSTAADNNARTFTSNTDRISRQDSDAWSVLGDVQSVSPLQRPTISSHQRDEYGMQRGPMRVMENSTNTSKKSESIKSTRASIEERLAKIDDFYPSDRPVKVPKASRSTDNTIRSSHVKESTTKTNDDRKVKQSETEINLSSLGLTDEEVAEQYKLLDLYNNSSMSRIQNGVTYSDEMGSKATAEKNIKSSQDNNSYGSSSSRQGGRVDGEPWEISSRRSPRDHITTVDDDIRVIGSVDLTSPLNLSSDVDPDVALAIARSLEDQKASLKTSTTTAQSTSRKIPTNYPSTSRNTNNIKITTPSATRSSMSTEIPIRRPGVVKPTSIPNRSVTSTTNTSPRMDVLKQYRREDVIKKSQKDKQLREDEELAKRLQEFAVDDAEYESRRNRPRREYDPMGRDDDVPYQPPDLSNTTNATTNDNAYAVIDHEDNNLREMIRNVAAFQNDSSIDYTRYGRDPLHDIPVTSRYGIDREEGEVIVEDDDDDILLAKALSESLVTK